MADGHDDNDSTQEHDIKEIESSSTVDELSDVNCSSKDAEKQPSVKRRLKSIAFGRHKRIPKDPSKKKRKSTWAFKLGCHMRPRTISNASETSGRCSSCICTSYKRTDDSFVIENENCSETITTTNSAAAVECQTLAQYSSLTCDNSESQSSSASCNEFILVKNRNSSHSDFSSRNYHPSDLHHNQELAREIWENHSANFSLISAEFQLSELTLTFHRRVNLSVIPYLERLNRAEQFSTVVNRGCEKSAESIQSLPTIHTRVDYVHCLVPDLLEIANCSFYWGKMDRYEAEKLLENKPEGTFLLRDSAQEEYLFSVSFRRYDRTLHARIEQWNHKFSFDPLDPGVFAASTVCGLIEHYKDPSCCMFFEPMLTIPLHRTFPFSLQHLSRAVICSRITYDSINKLMLPKSLRMYLKEYHYKQKVRVRCLDSDH